MRVTLQATDGDERGDTSIEHLESRKQASCKVHLVAAIGIETTTQTFHTALLDFEMKCSGEFSSFCRYD